MLNCIRQFIVNYNLYLYEERILRPKVQFYDLFTIIYFILFIHNL